MFLVINPLYKELSTLWCRKKWLGWALPVVRIAALWADFSGGGSTWSSREFKTLGVRRISMEWRFTMSKKMVVVLGVFLAIGLCCFTSVPAYSQVTGATLTGTVTDASGAVVAGAEISVKNTATGATRDVTSDSSGFYSAPNLAPGEYEVRVTAKGFSTAMQSNLSLAVGAQQQANFALKVGETSTTV